MVLKRHLREGGEGGSEFQNRAFKRPNPFARDVTKDSLQELVFKLEPFIRNCVSQEIERSISSFLRSPVYQIEDCPVLRNFQLHFDDELPTTIFTGCRVETETRSLVKVALRDARSRKIMTSGPLSSAKVTFVVLDGDFNKEDRDDWSQQEFKNRITQQREGKRPLVTGTLVITLKEGVGYIEDLSFTDNSSWTRSGKFRLGAITGDGSVREGVSRVFKVKDHRGESYKKHDRPSSADEVWRLKKIAKDGASHKRLESREIFNVKDFLRLYVTDPVSLRKILGNKISNKAWNTIIGHATACLLDANELYLYKASNGTLFVLNSIYEVVEVSFDGEHYFTLDMLDVSQKVSVENLKRLVYKNLNYLVPINDQSFVARQLVLQSLQTGIYNNPSLGYSAQNVNFPVEQDHQMETQFNSDTVKTSPSSTCGVEGNQFKVSSAETSNPMEGLNGLVNSDSYDGFPSDEYVWDVTSPLAPPLGFNHDPLTINENFHAGTSSAAWQGNGFFLAPANPSLGIISSDFGIRITSNEKPKSSWSKIRAVFKWCMIKSCCLKNGKATTFPF